MGCYKPEVHLVNRCKGVKNKQTSSQKKKNCCPPREPTAPSPPPREPAGTVWKQKTDRCPLRNVAHTVWKKKLNHPTHPKLKKMNQTQEGLEPSQNKGRLHSAPLHLLSNQTHS
jgi:hypothetical protein